MTEKVPSIDTKMIDALAAAEYPKEQPTKKDDGVSGDDSE